MNKLFKFILPIGLVPILANCGSKPSSDVTHYVTFHQELAEDKKVAFTKDTTDGEIIAQEPDIVAKDGYSAKWEDYTIVGKTEDFTVNAIYSENTYTARFRAKGVIVAEVPFTVNDVKGEHPKLPEGRTPECPSDVWYTYEWEDYKLELNDVVINAVQSGMVEHLAKFTDGETVIAENIPFTRENVDSNYQLDDKIIPDEVKNYHRDSEHPTYWDNHWDFTVPADADKVVTFDAAPTKHDFELMFVDFDGKQIGDIVNYQFDTDWATLNKPEVPSKVGYTVTWPKTITFSFDTDSPMKVGPTSVANKYIITYPDKSTQEVTYDSDYTLNQSASVDDLQMFYDGDKMIAPSGVWKIPNNVTLVKKNVDVIDFDNGYIPKFISTDTSKKNSLKVIDNPKGEGSVLEISIAPSDDSPYLILSKDYMTQAFKTEGINSIEFDAMASMNGTNFRSRYKVSRGGAAPAFSNNCYENDYLDGGLGIRSDRYKTFSFKKEYFTDQDSGNDLKFIYGNFGKANQKVYIDVIRLSTEKEIDYKGFEGGGVRLESTNQFKYSTGGRGGGADFPHFISRKDYLMVMDEKKTATDSVSLVNGINNGGITSLKIHKPANCAFPLYYWGEGTSNVPSKVSKIQFDIYCTKAFNQNSVKDGDNHIKEEFIRTFEANTWYTLVFDNLTLIEGQGETRHGNCSGDGRFAYIAGSSLEADFYIDNLVATLRS